MDVKEKVLQHLKPLCNVIYTKGEYFIYQADSLMNEPGLSSELAQKTQVDRYFVTSQIKSIAMKASVVVKNAMLPDMLSAFKEAKIDHKKHLKKEQEEDYYSEEEMEPIEQEAKLEVSSVQKNNISTILNQYYTMYVACIKLGIARTNLKAIRFELSMKWCQIINLFMYLINNKLRPFEI